MTTWADQFNTYQDACDFYGCDGPRELAAEARYESEQACIEIQDWMEAKGQPFFNYWAATPKVVHGVEMPCGTRDIEF